MSFLAKLSRGTAAVLLVAGLQAATNNAKVNNKPDLSAAVRAGNVAAVKQMIEKQGADPNAKDASGTPVLMTAVVYGDAELVRFLLDHGADPNAKNPPGATALLWAAGDPAKASLLIAHGADVNVQSALGRTPLLSAAAQDGAGPVVAKLLEKGANVNVADKLTPPPPVPSGDGGASPLIEAAKARDGAALKMLLVKGLDVNAHGTNGTTALSEATILGNVENVRLLLKAGARTEMRTSSGKYTPLMFAAFRNDPKLVQMLLDAGAEVNARDAVGSTVLMWAAYSDKTDTRVIEILLKAGADVNARNDRRESAMTWALWNGETPIVAFLRKSGAAAEASNASAKQAAAQSEAKADLRAAIEKGVAVLQPVGAEFFKKSGCISCHHQALPGMVYGNAKARGLKVDPAAAEKDLKTTVAFLKPAAEVLLEGSDVIPQVPQTGGLMLMSLNAQGYPADDMTTAIVHNIAMRQRPDGSWTGFAPRPPISGGDIRETAAAVFALQHYGPAGRRAEFDGRVKKAAHYLAQATPDTPDEAIVRLLGLAWSKADAGVVRKAAADVLAAQRADGGWSQLATRESDAYATGEALYALREAGVLTPASAEYKRGVKYLLDTQQADGSWKVKTRSYPFQPLIDTGFPHGRDQWISATGTSWALLALMATV
jgi:N-acyl-D-amino-acid deacylase